MKEYTKAAKELIKTKAEYEKLKESTKHIKNTLQKSASDRTNNNKIPNGINIQQKVINDNNLVVNVKVNQQKNRISHSICIHSNGIPLCGGKNMKIQHTTEESLIEKKLRITQAVEKARQEQKLREAADMPTNTGQKMEIVTTSPNAKKVVHIDISKPVSVHIKSEKGMTVSFGTTSNTNSEPAAPKPCGVEIKTRDQLKETIDGKYAAILIRFNILCNRKLIFFSYFPIAAYQRPDLQTAEECIKYRCAHCQKENQWTENFNTPKDVYTHWQYCHDDSDPFQFILVEHVACYYCKRTGTYHELLRHFKQAHHTVPFVIVSQKDSKKCALCSYTGTDIVGHSKTMHRMVSKTITVRNARSANTPQRLSNAVLCKHLAIKVHTRLKCGICAIMFESDRELRAHHNQCHKPNNLVIKEFYENHGMRYICHHCHESIDRSLLLLHFELHTYKFKCLHYSNKLTCSFQTNDLCKLVNHDKQAHGMVNSLEYRCLQYQKRLKADYHKSKVIFNNGLVTTKQKLINSKYDDSKQFYQFVNKLVTKKKQLFIIINQK